MGRRGGRADARARARGGDMGAGRADTRGHAGGRGTGAGRARARGERGDAGSVSRETLPRNISPTRCSARPPPRLIAPAQPPHRSPAIEHLRVSRETSRAPTTKTRESRGAQPRGSSAAKERGRGDSSMAEGRGRGQQARPKERPRDSRRGAGRANARQGAKEGAAVPSTAKAAGGRGDGRRGTPAPRGGRAGRYFLARGWANAYSSWRWVRSTWV